MVSYNLPVSLNPTPPFTPKSHFHTSTHPVSSTSPPNQPTDQSIPRTKPSITASFPSPLAIPEGVVVVVVAGVKVSLARVEVMNGAGLSR